MLKWYGTPVDKRHDNEKTFTSLEFFKFAIFEQKHVQFFFGMGQVTNVSAEFELNDLQNALTHCVTPLGN